MWEKMKVYVYLTIFLAILSFGVYIYKNVVLPGSNSAAEQNSDNRIGLAPQNVNPDNFTPVEFLHMLKEKPNEPVDASSAKAGWITREDVFSLLGLTGSHESCSPVWHNHLLSSAFPPKPSSTIGMEAQYMVDCFIAGRYPMRFYSNTPPKTENGTHQFEKDYQTWWQGLDANLQGYTDAEKLILLYNEIKAHPEYDVLQKALIQDAVFQYFPYLSKIHEDEDIRPELQKKAPASADLLHWAHDCAYENDKALYCFLQIGINPMSEGIRQEYLNYMDNLLRKRDVSFFKQLAELEKGRDITGIIQMGAYLFIKDKSLINYLEGRQSPENKVYCDRIMAAYNQIIRVEPDVGLKEQAAFEEKYLSSDFYTARHILPLHYDIQKNICIGYKMCAESIDENKGTITLVGIPEGTTEIMRCRLDTGKSEPVGRMGVIVNSCLSYDRKYLAVNDANSVGVIDIQNGSMKMLREGDKAGGIYHTNWSKDSSRLYIHLNEHSCYYAYDVMTGKMISQRGGFQPGEEIFRGYAKSAELYSREKMFGVVNSLYKTAPENHEILDEHKPNVIHDIFGDWLLVTVEYRGEGSGSDTVFERYNVLTGESNPIEYFNTYKAPYNIYKACFLKNTGEILFTRVVPEELGYAYELVKLSPSLEVKATLRVNAPMFTLSPGETELYFSHGKGCWNPGFVVDAGTFEMRHLPAESGAKQYSKSFAEFLITMKRAYLFYTGQNCNHGEEIFTNTDKPIPQYALDHVKREIADRKDAGIYIYERFYRQMPLSYSADDNGNKIHAKLNLYFYSPHELIKEGSGTWKITGFSTYPGSRERDNILNTIVKGLGFQNGSLKGKVNEGSNAAFAALVNKTVEIGEIELWTTSDPHRAPDLQWVNLAQVRLNVFAEDNRYDPYIVHLSRPGNSGAWSIGSVSLLE